MSLMINQSLWCLRADSNCRPLPYQGSALPTELPGHNIDIHQLRWWGEKDLNLRRRSRQIYSLIPLATRESPHNSNITLVPAGGIELPTY